MDDQQKSDEREFDIYMRDLYRQLMASVGAVDHQEALRKLAELKERSGVLEVVMKHLGVNHHWEVVGNLKSGETAVQETKENE